MILFLCQLWFHSQEEELQMEDQRLREEDSRLRPCVKWACWATDFFGNGSKSTCIMRGYEHPFTNYVDVHQNTRVLIHNPFIKAFSHVRFGSRRVIFVQTERGILLDVLEMASEMISEILNLYSSRKATCNVWILWWSLAFFGQAVNTHRMNTLQGKRTNACSMPC